MFKGIYTYNEFTVSSHISYIQRVLKGKMGTGICPFFGWENRISCTGTGIQKTIENWNGIRIRARKALRQRDLCGGAMGFSQNLGWEMEIGSLIQILRKLEFTYAKCLLSLQKL